MLFDQAMVQRQLEDVDAFTAQASKIVGELDMETYARLLRAVEAFADKRAEYALEVGQTAYMSIATARQIESQQNRPAI